MRRFLLSVGVLIIVVATVAGATAWATGARRSDDAITRLEDGARRLQECHARRDTYDGCESGEAQVDNMVEDDTFTLSDQVFGVGRLSITGSRGANLQRTCDEHGTQCGRAAWRGPATPERPAASR